MSLSPPIANRAVPHCGGREGERGERNPEREIEKKVPWHVVNEHKMGNPYTIVRTERQFPPRRLRCGPACSSVDADTAIPRRTAHHDVTICALVFHDKHAPITPHPHPREQQREHQQRVSDDPLNHAANSFEQRRGNVERGSANRIAAVPSGRGGGIIVV